MLDLITTANSEKSAEQLQFEKIAEGTLSRFENNVYKLDNQGNKIHDYEGHPIILENRFDKFRINTSLEGYARDKGYTFGFKRDGSTVYFVIGDIKGGIAFKKTSRQTIGTLAEVLDKAFPEVTTNRYKMTLNKVEGTYHIYTLTPDEPFEFKKRTFTPEQIEARKAALASYQAERKALKETSSYTEDDFQLVENNVNIASIEETI